jgi:hypothetical protein
METFPNTKEELGRSSNDASVVPPSLKTLSALAERRAQYRGAATEVIGEIFHGANSMVAARRYIPGKRLEVVDG